jgi:hypothetical protein
VGGDDGDGLSNPAEQLSLERRGELEWLARVPSSAPSPWSEWQTKTRHSGGERRSDLRFFVEVLFLAKSSLSLVKNRFRLQTAVHC